MGDKNGECERRGLTWRNVKQWTSIVETVGGPAISSIVRTTPFYTLTTHMGGITRNQQSAFGMARLLITMHPPWFDTSSSSSFFFWRWPKAASPKLAAPGSVYSGPVRWQRTDKEATKDDRRTGRQTGGGEGGKLGGTTGRERPQQGR